MKKRRECKMEIERRRCGIKIVEMEKDIGYVKEDVREIKDGLNEMRHDIKKLISNNSKLEGKASMFGAISGMITGFITIVLSYLLKGK